MTFKFRYIIKKSRTGVYHEGDNGSSGAHCNSRLALSTSWPSRVMVEKASEGMFCLKCFGGKPSPKRLDYFFPVEA